MDKPKSVIRLAECVSCFRRGMLLCILFASVRILLRSMLHDISGQSTQSLMTDLG